MDILRLIYGCLDVEGIFGIVPLVLKRGCGFSPQLDRADVTLRHFLKALEIGFQFNC